MTDNGYIGPVHDFHPTSNHAHCSDLSGGVRCGKFEDSSVHQFVTQFSSGDQAVCYVKIILPNGATSSFLLTGEHYATLAWQSENEGSWFSAWYHMADSKVWYRANEFDCKSGVLMTGLIVDLIDQQYSKEFLIESGIKEQG